MLEADIRHEATCARARGRQGIGPLSLVLMKYAVREVSACRLPLLSSVCLLLRVPLARVPCLCPCEIWLCWSCPLSLSLCWSCVSRVNSLVSCACGLCGAASLLLVACLCVSPSSRLLFNLQVYPDVLVYASPACPFLSPSPAKVGVCVCAFCFLRIGRVLLRISCCAVCVCAVWSALFAVCLRSSWSCLGSGYATPARDSGVCLDPSLVCLWLAPTHFDHCPILSNSVL